MKKILCLLLAALLILSAVRGLAGIQEAQPLAYVLSFPLALYFALRFLRKIPAEDQELSPGTGKDPAS